MDVFVEAFDMDGEHLMPFAEFVWSIASVLACSGSKVLFGSWTKALNAEVARERLHENRRGAIGMFLAACIVSLHFDWFSISFVAIFRDLVEIVVVTQTFCFVTVEIWCHGSHNWVGSFSHLLCASEQLSICHMLRVVNDAGSKCILVGSGGISVGIGSDGGRGGSSERCVDGLQAKVKEVKGASEARQGGQLQIGWQH